MEKPGVERGLRPLRKATWLSPWTPTCRIRRTRIPELYRMIREEGYDIVSGYKQKRYDPLSKTIPTKLFNATRAV